MINIFLLPDLACSSVFSGRIGYEFGNLVIDAESLVTLLGPF